MKKNVIDKYVAGFICCDGAVFKSPAYGKLNSEIKEIVSSALESKDINLSKIYSDCIETIIHPFTDKCFEIAEKERELDQPVEFEEVSPLEKTAFMPTVNTFNENEKTDESIDTKIYSFEDYENNKDEKRVDESTFDTNVYSFDDYEYNNEPEKVEEDSKTFIIDFDKLNSNTENSEKIEISNNEVLEESEEIEEVEEKAKTKVLSFSKNKKDKKNKELKKTGYVDTVILCLVAQLTIFGILILVLLVIK